MMEINKIHNIDARQGIKKLPNDFIDCSMSSPPYWALRDYGIEPQIWDGDINCEHSWGTERKKELNLVTGANSQCDRPWREQASSEDVSQGQFCQKCSAWKGSLGLEPTSDLFIKHLCNIYDEVKRVLKPSGTCWVNLGDTYGGMGHSDWSGNDSWNTKKLEYNKDFKLKRDVPDKSLTLIPFRFAIEMINRGWILRNTIIWHKPNCMPSSAKDRFTVDFEYLFFFVKSKKYFFEAQYEPHKEIDARTEKGLSRIHYNGKGNPEERNFSGDANWLGQNPLGRNKRTVWSVPYSVQPRGKPFVDYRNLPNLDEFSIFLNKARKSYKSNKTIDEVEEYFGNQAPHHWFNAESFPSKADYIKLKELLGFDDRYDKQLTEEFTKSSEKQDYPQGRNKRTTWSICPQPFPEAHFAVYPEALCETPIKSGCPEFVCKKCGKAREKIYDKELPPKEVLTKTREKSDKMINVINKDGEAVGSGQKYQNWKNENPPKFKGYTQCSCNSGFEGGIVLDPFIGAGTTALVALKQNKRFIGFEINKQYIEIANKRIKPYLEQNKLSSENIEKWSEV